MMPTRIQRFEVIAQLGTGGVGTVYRAHDPQLEREVAIKVLAQRAAAVLSPDRTIDLRGDGPADDLLREARMMARLSHPNVLPVYEVGLADGAVFVVMEHIAGCDLAAWLEEPRATEDILAVFAQAARGLAAAHAHGIVHRDFKPANVLVGRDGRVRVADFGLSRLTHPAALPAARDDGYGTPRFMAPELWRGGAASPQSDVYALCAALADALGPGPGATGDEPDPAWRPISPALRAAIVRGLGDDPAGRPDVALLLDLLEVPAARSHRRMVAAVAAVAVIVVGLGIVALVRHTTSSVAAEPCALDRTLFAGRWDPIQRVRLAARLATAAPPALATVLAELDGRKRVIIEGHTRACRALHDGTLAAPAVRIRTGCLERRAFELGATVERARATAADVHEARDRFDAMPEAADCDELVVPASPADRRATAALYERWTASAELSHRAADAHAHQSGLEALAGDAARLGDPELAARAALALGTSLRFSDQLADADAAAQRAYRAALDLHASNLTTKALIERCAIATLRGDATSASQLAELAEAAADRPNVALRTRAQLRVVLGRAAAQRGDYKAAIAGLEQGLAIIGQSGRALPGIESEMRFNLTDALVKIGGRNADAVSVARANVALLAQTAGVGDPNYGVALNMLAYALSNGGDVAQAVVYRRQALAVMQATQPPDSSHLVLEHADVASDLWALGELEAAHREIAGAVAQTEHNQTLAGSRTVLLPLLATVTFDLGRHAEAVAILDEALESSISQLGKDHPSTLEVRWEQIRFELELGQLAQAERHLAALETMFRARSDVARLTLAQGWFGGELAIARGHPELAERMTREALAAQDELHGMPADRSQLHHTQGRALIAQRRWGPARAALDEARRLARGGQVRADAIAAIDVDLARIDAATGRRAAARSRARAARRVLDTFPGQVVARRDAAALAR